MYLLKIDDDDSLELTENYINDPIPPYAIVSHTWAPDEVAASDVKQGIASSKAGYFKLQLFAREARKDGLRYLWIDSCCTDVSEALIDSDAIDATFERLECASECYVYLDDVSTASHVTISGATGKGSWEYDFETSRWFTRSWTLQELLAPSSVQFFSKEGTLLGSRNSLEDKISQITGIPSSALRGAPLMSFSIDERISWMDRRRSTRPETRAYALLGLSGVAMAIRYGEGEVSAFTRLRGAVAEASKMAAQWYEGSRGKNNGYEYMPLGPSEIRVLVLQPGTHNEELEIGIKTTSLEDPCAYKALSYVWGQEPALHPIKTDYGELLFARPNLFHALRRMRHVSEEIYLWVDAMCINQSDPEERTQQVQGMREVYCNAEEVWIWLGEESADSAHAMDLISGIKLSHSKTIESFWNVQSLVAFNALLARSWFERGWVVQEVAYAGSATLFCGDRQVKWEDLASSIVIVKSLDVASSGPDSQRLTLLLDTLLNNFRDSPAMTLLRVVKQVFERDEKSNNYLSRVLSLEDLVELGTSFETTDPRDSIYALLGLARDSELAELRPTVKPDYTKPNLNVFADFILHCCSASGSLDIVCRPWAPTFKHNFGQAQFSDAYHQPYTPSWIRTRDQLPFGDPCRKSSHRLHGDCLVSDSQNRIYNAHKETLPSASILGHWHDSQERSLLRAQGVTVGNIEECSARIGSAIITANCLDMLGGADANSTEVALQPESVWRVLCADRFDRSHPEGGYDKAKLESLWMDLQRSMVSRRSSSTTASFAFDIEEYLEREGSADVQFDTIPEIREYLELVRDTVWNRRTFRGHRPGNMLDGIFGLVPRHARADDIVCVLAGLSVPIVLRKLQGTPGETRWQLIGEAYVHGYMDGEAVSGGLADEFDIV